MSLSEKIASALKNLIGEEEPKKAEHIKTLDLFGYPDPQPGDENIEATDPGEVPIEPPKETADVTNSEVQGEDSVESGLVVPEQSNETVVDTGHGSQY